MAPPSNGLEEALTVPTPGRLEEPLAPSPWKHKLRAVLGRPPQVAVLRLDGVIAPRARFQKSVSIDSHGDAIERAFRLAGLKAVALVVNSPGGSAAQAALLHDRIRAHAAERKVPVYAFVEDVAASGGYWLACAGDEILAQPTSILGSIGVIYAGFGFADAIARLGVERRIHTAGEKKSILDPFRPESEEDVARLKRLQAEIHEAFIALVRDRRGGRLNDVDGDLFSGAFWTGEPARARGLIDGFGDLRQVMRARFGDKVRLRPVKAEKGLLPRFGIGSRADLATSLADEAETRLMWSRYGL